jgi:hypothetical protein
MRAKISILRTAIAGLAFVIAAPLAANAAAAPAYTVTATQSGGATVREYRSASGEVFAIAWTGLAHPNLPKLLGPYADEYRDGLVANPRIPGHRSQHSFQTAHLVVQKWGHMRKLGGRAYLPALLPNGVKADDIR